MKHFNHSHNYSSQLVFKAPKAEFTYIDETINSV